MADATASAAAQCDALDMNGRRCRRKAVSVESYHGDWVRVKLCEKHKAPHRINRRREKP